MISRHRPLKTTTTKFDAGEAVCFIVGLVAFVEIPLIGTLFAANVLLLMIVCYLALKRGKDLLSTRCALVLILATVWLASQIFTDLYRNSTPQDYLRGWAKITFLTTNFAAAYLLLKTDRRIIIFFVGFILGSLCKFLLNPDPSALDDPWKWGLSSPTTLTLVLLSTIYYKKQKPILPVGFLLIASILNVYFNNRAMGMFCFGACACVILSNGSSQRNSTARLWVATVGLAASAWGFGLFYGYLAGNGYLGTEARLKYESQSAGDFGMLLGGRNESLSSIQAIIDTPIIGHGSWARDAYYGVLLKTSMVEHGYKETYAPDDLIPTHSHILGAWVEAGILGALFWAFVGYIALSGISQLLSANPNLRPLSFFCGITLIWDILFSPFAGIRTVITPIYLVVMLTAATTKSKVRTRVSKGTTDTLIMNPGVAVRQ